MLNTIDAMAVEQDWRFAELVAQTWIEPKLADRYATDPCAVLAEFGMKVTNRFDAPALVPPAASTLVIDRLDTMVITRSGTSGFCVSDAGDTRVPPTPAPAPSLVG